MRSQISGSRAWFARIQRSNADSVGKLLIRLGSGMIGAMARRQIMPHAQMPQDAKTYLNRCVQNLARCQNNRWRRVNNRGKQAYERLPSGRGPQTAPGARLPGSRCPVPGARCPVPGSRLPVPATRYPLGS